MSERIMDTSNMEWTKDNPIVRCHDCRFYDAGTLRFSDGESGSNADLVPFCDYMRRDTQPYGFCKWGERNEAE